MVILFQIRASDLISHNVGTLDTGSDWPIANLGNGNGENSVGKNEITRVEA